MMEAHRLTSTSLTYSQPDHVYVEVIDQTGLGVDGIWISDGANIYDLNERNKTYTQAAFRNSLKDSSNLPTNSSEISPNTVRLHPLAMVIDLPSGVFFSFVVSTRA